MHPLITAAAKTAAAFLLVSDKLSVKFARLPVSHVRLLICRQVKRPDIRIVEP
jgi:hypothetical protein